MIRKERTLRIINKSKQRGGPTRLLGTNIKEHKSNMRQPFSSDEEDEESKDHDSDVKIILKKAMTPADMDVSEE